MPVTSASHANYRSKEFVMQPEDVALIAQGEDLHVTNLMVSNSDGGIIHDQQWFQGRPHPLSTSSHTLYWNQEMRNYGLYGHLVLLNLKQLVRPIYTGFPGTEHERIPRKHDPCPKCPSARRIGEYPTPVGPQAIVTVAQMRMKLQLTRHWVRWTPSRFFAAIPKPRWISTIAC